ncbi:hypothetical protein [Bacillus toyonensis]|uniref:hypothetical protein n=1 Tax=Bacillus toyonensis TaxID=155322 RepID=UPI002E1B2A36|nr:hypothetical protein [Bacillus toyonensis]
MSTALKRRLDKVQEKIISEVNLQQPYLNIHRSEDELSLFSIYLVQTGRNAKTLPQIMFFNNLEYEVNLDSIPSDWKKLLREYVEVCNEYFYKRTIMYRGDGTFFIKEWEDIATTDSRDPEILSLIKSVVKQEHLLTLEMQLCFMEKEDAILLFIGRTSQMLFDAATEINVRTIKVYFELNLFRIYTEVVNKYISEKHIRKNILSLEIS